MAFLSVTGRSLPGHFGYPTGSSRNGSGAEAGEGRGGHAKPAGAQCPGRPRPAVRGSRCQLWFQVTVKLVPPDSAEVVAFVVLPDAMLILSGE